MSCIVNFLCESVQARRRYTDARVTPHACAHEHVTRRTIIIVFRCATLPPAPTVSVIIIIIIIILTMIITIVIPAYNSRTHIALAYYARAYDPLCDSSPTYFFFRDKIHLNALEMLLASLISARSSRKLFLANNYLSNANEWCEITFKAFTQNGALLTRLCISTGDYRRQTGGKTGRDVSCND